MKKLNRNSLVSIVLIIVFSVVGGAFVQVPKVYATDYPPCPFTPQIGRIIVNFQVGSAGDPTYEFTERIVSDIVNYPAYSFQTPPVSVTIAAGSYNVSIFSADAGIDRASLVTEPNERFFIILNNGSTEVARTDSTDDLLDGVNSIGVEKLVNTNLILAQAVNSILAYHSNYPDTTSANSVVPICAAFDLQTPPPLVTTQLIANKVVVNDNGGTKVISDFPLFVDGGSVTSGVTNTTTVGLHTVSETSDPNYISSFSGDCNASGIVTLALGDNKVCTITNDDIAAIAPPPLAPPPVSPPPTGGGGPPAVPPLINVVKVPSPLALPLGPGPVKYTYTLHNIGVVPVTDITMVGDTCSPIVLISGDTNNDKRLDVNETWVYTCTTTLSRTHTNIVTATGWANGISAVDIASATVVVGVPGLPNTGLVPPLIHVTKVPNPLALRAGGGLVTYTNIVTNPGIVPLSNVRLTDDKCGPVNYNSGDINGNAMLDINESWIYTCRTNLSKTTTNTVVAEGSANGFTAKDFAIVTVIVAIPGFPDTGYPPEGISLDTMMLTATLTLVLGILAVLKRRTM